MQRSTAHLALALLIAAGLGVSVSSVKARGQGSTTKKPVTRKTAQSSKSSGSTVRKSSSKSRGKSRKGTRRSKGQQSPTVDRITEIQQALAKDGSFTGTPTGKWDDSTVESVRRFQDAHGLNPSGKLDAHTLQQLGLGSEITGIAPPTPASSSRQTSSTTSQATPPASPPPATPQP